MGAHQTKTHHQNQPTQGKLEKREILTVNEPENFGRIYTWGCGVDGRLGNGNEQDSNTPVRVDSSHFGNKPLAKISGGRRHSAAITVDGELYTWGGNDGGALGLTGKDRHIPTIIPYLSKVVEVSCGLELTALFTEENLVYVSRSNSTLAPVVQEKADLPAMSKSKILSISAGVKHVLVLSKIETLSSTQHVVHSFGLNNYNQLGYSTPQLMMSADSMNKFMKRIPFDFGNKPIKQIAAGGYHSMVLTEDGDLYSFGYNEYGQCLVVPEETKRVSSPRLVLSKEMFEKKTCIEFVDYPYADGNIWETAFICGGNNHTVLISKKGEVGIIGRLHSNTSVSYLSGKGSSLKNQQIVYGTAGFQHSFVLSDKGKVFGWGTGSYGELLEKSSPYPKQLEPLDGTFIEQISSGHYHVLALTALEPTVGVESSSYLANMERLFNCRDELLESSSSSNAIQVKFLDSSKSFKMHKEILSCWPELSQSFLVENNCVALPFLAEHGMLLGEFLYSQSISKATPGQLDALLEISMSLHLKDLAESINQYLAKNKNNNNNHGLIELNSPNARIITEILFNNEKDCDFLFVVEGKTIFAHRSILSARCDRFRAQFLSGMADSHASEYRVDDRSYESFYRLLEYLYTDNVTLNEDNVVEVLQIASEYFLDRLVQLCEVYIRSSMTVDTVCQLWQISEECRAFQLWRYCKYYIGANYADVVKSGDWEMLPSSLKDEFQPK